MSSELEIIRIGKQLEKLASSTTPNEEVVRDLLVALQGLPISLDVLQKSRVGVSVNKLRKKCGKKEVSSVAKKLIKSWKKLLPTGSSSSKDSPLSPTPSSEATPTFHSQISSPPTPPPVTYIPPTSFPGNGVAAKNSNASVTSPSTPNGGESPFGGGAFDFSNDLYFGPGIDGASRGPSTGSDVRDRCRDLIVKALSKGFTNVSIENDIKFYNLGAEIEICIFSEFRDTGNKYKTRIRSRVSNLGDLKNPALRLNVISGHILPPKIATMTTEEMASDAMKDLRKQLTKDAIRDAQMAISSGTNTSLLKCGKCRKRNCTYNQAQTRSADEPMTTFAYCNDCGHRWKFC